MGRLASSIFLILSSASGTRENAGRRLLSGHPSAARSRCPFAEAKTFFRNILLDCLAAGPRSVDEALSRQAASVKAKRFLHISDLHFGDVRSNASRRYIKSQLNLMLDDIDRVVVTGDLFNSPSAELRNQFLDYKPMSNE